jgi:uncharacterized membrane protein YbhN (UPF0104 family)
MPALRRPVIHRHTWKWLTGCALAIAALAWILYSQWPKQGFDWPLAAASVMRLRWRWLLASLAPIYNTYWGRALRWAVFLKPLKPRPSMSKLPTATIIGFTAITLFGRAGDSVRPYLIAVKEQVPVTSQLAAWLLERVFDLLMASLLLGFALSPVHGAGLHVGPTFAWVLAFGGRIVRISCILVLVVLLSLRHFAEPARRRLIAAFHFLPEARFQRVERMLTALVQGVESTRSDGALLLIFVYSILEWVLIATC